MMKLYFLTFHFFMGLYVSGGFFIAMTSFFKVSWAENFRELAPVWRKLAPFMGLLFVPLIFWGRDLVPISLNQDHKALYFSLWSTFARCALLSGTLWIGARYLLTSPVASLFIYFFSGTLIAIDWAMALEAHWTSNIYGLIYLLNFALIFFAGLFFLRVDRLKEKERKDLFHLLMTLGISWGYLHYSQFIILWMGNKPSEVTYYLKRHYPLGLMSVVVTLKLPPMLFIGCFSRLKISARIIKLLTALMVVAGWMELNWLLDPPLGLSWTASLGFGSLMIIACALFLRTLWRRFA